MDERDLDEHDLHDVLENGIGPEPPVVGGPAAVFAGARARMVRTRVLTGALSVTAVLGVTAGAVALGNAGAHGTGNGTGVSALGGADVSKTSATSAEPLGGTAAATAPAKHARVDPPKPGAGQSLVTGVVAADTLKQLLPAGTVTKFYNGQDSGSPGAAVNVYGAMAIDTGHGLDLVSVNVQQGMNDMFQQFCSGSCTVLPDGSQLTVRTVDGDKPTAAGALPAVGVSADRVWPDGTRVVVGVQNYFDDPSAQHGKNWTLSVTGATVPLTDAQLTAIASSTKWSLLVPADAAAHAKQDLPGYVDRTQR